MPYTAYKLAFTSPLHIGLEGIGQEDIQTSIRSDTLWGAISSLWGRLHPATQSQLWQNCPFKLSSCFPYVQDRFYLPLPTGALDEVMQKVENHDTIKDLKKVSYLSWPVFDRYLQGATLTWEDVQHPGAIWPEIADEGQNSNAFYAVQERPRLAIDPLTGHAMEGQFFYCADQYFYPECGMYFLAQFNDSEWQKQFEAVLALLGDQGIGADNSVGRGQFTFTRQTLDLSVPQKADGYCVLSLFQPSPEEVSAQILSHSQSRYSLVRRFGRCGTRGVNQYRRADTWMLAEGSCIAGQQPKGRIVQVLSPKADPERIPHPVYRNGQAFAVPFAARG